MKATRLFLMAVTACALSQSTLAVSLSLAPGAQAIPVGGTASINIVVSGLGTGTAPSLGAFDIEILYDDSLLSIDTSDATVTGFLGIPDVDTIVSTYDLAGSFSVANLSLLVDPADLDALQPSAFTLATLNFFGLAVGEASLTFGTVVLSDAFGVGLDLNLAEAQVLITPASVADQGGLPLLLLSVFGLFGFSRVGGYQRLRSVGLNQTASG